MFTVDDVDWNQIPPDNNTGIQFPVQLQTEQRAHRLGNAHVNQVTAADLSSTVLTVKSDITNNSSSSQTGTVTATITPPNGGAPITATASVTVAAGATTTVTFPAKTITAPAIWWPYQMGAQPLYTLTTSVAQGSAVSNSTSEQFGVRTVTSYLTGSSAAEPQGTRAFKINGVPIVIRGGGFDARSVPPLLAERHREADRADEEHGHQHDPARRATSCRTTSTSRWTPPAS